LVGIDPGWRLAVGGVRLDKFYPPAPPAITPIKISSKTFRHWTKEHVRREKLKKWSSELEDEIRERREALDNIGPSHEDFRKFTRFELEFLQRRGLELDHKGVSYLAYEMVQF
jgi:hypothetical protein